MIHEQFNTDNMRKINEDDFVSYTIAGNGWNVTVPTFKKALKQWDEIPHGTLYGNKPNGDRAVIDSREPAN